MFYGKTKSLPILVNKLIMLNKLYLYLYIINVIMAANIL